MPGRPTKDPYTRPAINTLERLHAELGAQILENKAEAIKLSGKMLHVEAVIKMLDPAFNLRRIAVKRRQPNPWFKRGTVYRRAVDTLRTATEPLTAREIGELVLEKANMKRPDKDALQDLIGTINSSLRNHDGKGVQRTNEGSPARWRLHTT
jgi:hypothetical protein